MSTAPCKDCERKGCGTYHDECPPYLKWLAEKRANDEKFRKEKEIDSLLRRKRRRFYD